MEGAGQLVSTLGQLVGEEYRQLRGVGGQVAELRDELATMNAILRMQSEADDGTVDHFIREWMQQVRDLAYDAEDCVDVYIFLIRCRMRDLGFLVWSKRLLATLFYRHRLAGEIQALRARAVAISERHVRYSVTREALISRVASTPPLAPPPAPYNPSRYMCTEFVGDQYAPHVNSTCSHDDLFIGHQDHILARKLLKKWGDGEELKVCSILGFRGMGKTRLAMAVCRQLEVEFQPQLHVSLSRTFSARKDLKTLLKRMLLNCEQDTLDEIDGMSVDHLADRLKERLERKRYEQAPLTFHNYY